MFSFNNNVTLKIHLSSNGLAFDNFGLALERNFLVIERFL